MPTVQQVRGVISVEQLQLFREQGLITATDLERAQRFYVDGVSWSALARECGVALNTIIQTRDRVERAAFYNNIVIE